MSLFPALFLKERHRCFEDTDNRSILYRYRTPGVTHSDGYHLKYYLNILISNELYNWYVFKGNVCCLNQNFQNLRINRMMSEPDLANLRINRMMSESEFSELKNGQNMV